MDKIKKYKFSGAVILAIFFAFGPYSAFADKQEESQATLPDKEVKRLAAAISHIKNYYIHPISDEELFDHAIKGMLSNLDPHSNYLNSTEYQDLNSNTKGEFSGVGLEVTLDEDVLKVISALDDSPAAKAGIKTGDLIITIDNTPIKGLTLREAIQKLRGAKGSQVTLVIIRKGEKKPLTYKLVRNLIITKSVKVKLFEGGFGYLRIANFQSPTAIDVQKGIAELNRKNGGVPLRGLVLDLRNNPGGLLNSAVEIADSFLDSHQLKNNQLIVYTKGRAYGSSFDAKATKGDILKGAPMVVMINEGSASAAEILAGALQDHKRALLVGQKSFGKGSVQTVMPLNDKTALKLTTAFYYTPSGRLIQAKGIEPDVILQDADLTPLPEKSDAALTIKEENLSKHLKTIHSKNLNQDDPKLLVNESDIEKTDLAKDFQLYQAINLLKGLTVMRQ